MKHFVSLSKRLFAVSLVFLLSIAGASAQWTKVGAAVPNNSFNNWHMTTQLDGKLYMFGGLLAAVGGTTGEFVANAWVMDLKAASPKWTPIADMPEPRCGGFAAVVNGKIYLVGGYYAVGSTPTPVPAVWEYDPSTDSYAEKASINTASYQIAGVVVGTKIYAMGGIANNAYSRAVQVYDVATDTWSTSTSVPAAYAYSTASVIGNTIYYIGGNNGSGYSANTYKGVINGSTITWTTVAAYPVALTRLASGVVDGKICVAGGVGANGESKAAYKYDPTANTWTATFGLPMGLYNVSHMPSDGTTIYLISGINNPDTYKFVEGAAVPVANVGPLSLAYTFKTGSTGAKDVVVANNGVVDLTVSVAVSANTPWLTINPASFTVTAGSSKTIKVTANSTGMKEGKYNGSLTLTTNDDKNKTFNIPVTMTTIDNVAKRRPLLEVFTSSTCPPCKPGNENLHSVLAGMNRDDYTVLKFQQDFPGTGDPYCTNETVARRNFYAVNSIPRMEVDGAWDQNAQSFTSDILSTFSGNLSFLNLDVKHTVNGKKVHVDVTADPMVDFSSSNLKIVVAICEKRTVQNVKSNGETEFLDVVKKLLPDQNGLAISAMTKGTKVTKSFDFEFVGDYRLPANGLAASRINHTMENSVEDFKNFEVVAWIQDFGTKEVLNSAWSTQGVTGAEEVASVPTVSLDQIAPNPANGLTTFKFTMPTYNSAKLEVFNVLGEKVSTVFNGFAHQGVNAQSFDTANLPAGAYSVILTVGNHTSILPMTVVH